MAQSLTTTPRADGFRMPAEYEPHAGTWMLWPERPDVWREHGRPAQESFVEIATTIARFEPVTVGVRYGLYDSARAMLPAHIRVVELTSSDAWVRDCGPTFIVNNRGDVRGIDWIFNAWGGHFADFQNDAQVARKIMEVERADYYQPQLINEGGAIHVDGEGTLMTTISVLQHPGRNPHLSLEQMDDIFRDYLNVEKVIWLDEGVYKDETSGHIDNMACFIRPGVVAITWTDDETDPQYPISQAVYELLCNSTDAQGRPFEVHKLHQPGPFYMTSAEAATIEHRDQTTLERFEGNRLAGSYVNFYLVNGGVIVPIFGDPYDEPALAKLRELYPEREVVGIQAREILLGGGNIHCITQQLPAPQLS